MLRFFIFLLSLSPFVLTEETASCKGADCVPATWHNVRCSTRDDCDEPHAVCYKHLCRCEDGYFYTTQDTCTNTCSKDDLQDNFTEYPDSALRGHYLDSEDGLSLEDCKGKCQANKLCLTFDFKASGGLCRLHNVTAHESPSEWAPKRSKGWTHYQRSCNSTLASHDTWYNLLCHSKVDCPHPHSDCLSGRCLCRLDFEFNEAEKECRETKLSKWHNGRCSTDDDCNRPHAVCYQQLCRCEAGYYYTTHDTCTSTCSTDELQKNFTEYPDSALRGHYLDSWNGLSLEACKGRCQAHKLCLTFDFKADGGLCRLHNVTAHERPSHWYPKTSKGWTHYQKSCNSTFATHDTWYNLLCHSEVDCPDPNSDCLSGRCLCHSGLKFNETEKECRAPMSCKGWQAIGGKSGVYTVQLPNKKGSLRVWCDMDTTDGGWLVIQRRRDFTVDFNRSWTEYKNGFGNISGDYWLGLDAIGKLMNHSYSRLRVDLVADPGRKYWAEYGEFFFSAIFYGDSPIRGYGLHVSGYSGDAGNGLTPSYQRDFITYDRNLNGCFSSRKGAWWYPYDCSTTTNLFTPDKNDMTWGDIGRVTFSEMKIKSEWY